MKSDRSLIWDKKIIWQYIILSHKITYVKNLGIYLWSDILQKLNINKYCCLIEVAALIQVMLKNHRSSYGINSFIMPEESPLERKGLNLIKRVQTHSRRNVMTNDSNTNFLHDSGRAKSRESPISRG